MKNFNAKRKLPVPTPARGKAETISALLRIIVIRQLLISSRTRNGRSEWISRSASRIFRCNRWVNMPPLKATATMDTVRTAIFTLGRIPRRKRKIPNATRTNIKAVRLPDRNTPTRAVAENSNSRA